MVKLNKLSSNYPLYSLPYPIKLLLAREPTLGEAPRLVTKWTRVDLRLGTSRGIVSLKNVPVLVDEHLHEDVLMGNRALEAIGITDINDLLGELAGRYYDLAEVRVPGVSCSKIQSISCQIKDDEDKGLEEATTMAEEVESLIQRYRDDDGDHEVDPDSEISVGPTDPKELDEALKVLIQVAIDNGLPKRLKARMETIVKRCRNIFRVAIGMDPPAKVEPLKIHLMEGAKPVRARARRYPKNHRTFLHERTRELVKHGLLRENRGSRWSSAAHVVAKKAGADGVATDFRWTVDLRRVNSQTVPIAGAMPNLEQVRERVAGSSCYQQLDFFKGFWQLPLDKSCQEYFSIVTDEGIYTPTRVIQGSTDAALYFQSVMQECFKERLQDSLVVWIDDVLSHAKTPDELIDIMEYIFNICIKRNLKLNAKKCVLFTTSVTFCGKIITAEGSRHDPKRIDGLVSMPTPRTAAELQTFIHASNWMREHLPDYARRVNKLREFYEDALAGGKRTKRAAAAKVLEWNTEMIGEFENVKDLIRDSVQLSHPSEDAEYGLFTDASDIGWGAALFQVREYDPTVAFWEQACEPLAFLGGTFKGAQSRWAIIDKEAYAILRSIVRLRDLLIRSKGFTLFCDHRNLMYIFGEHTEMKTSTSERLERWAFQLAAYRYKIVYIAGETNLWADLISRWGNPSRLIETRVAGLVAVPMIAPLEDSFEWPTPSAIIKSQQGHSRAATGRTDIVKNESGVWYHGDRLWVPEGDKGLKSRILVAGHFGIAGHRGINATEEGIKSVCYWRGINRDTRVFVSSCLHCLQTRAGETIPRPWGRTVESVRPNEVLQFDYLTLEEAENNIKYILVLKDKFSHYVELVASEAADATTVVSALLDWIKRFGLPPTLVSDQGTHFRNSVVKDLCVRLGLHHHFVTARCPWANGSVERVNRDIIALSRTYLNERKWGAERWPETLPLIQFTLNQTPSASLGGKAPVEIMCGLQTTRPLDVLFSKTDKVIEQVAPTSDDYHQHLTSLREALKDMHAIAWRAQERQSERANTGRTWPEHIEIGDYVLWSQVDMPGDTQGTKAKTGTWRGPYRVIDSISKWVYTIESLLDKSTRDVHVSRLKWYSDKDLRVTQELRQHVQDQETTGVVDHLGGLQFNGRRRRWECLVFWQGYEDSEATWEPLKRLKTDVPLLLERHLRKMVEEGQKDGAKAGRSVGLSI